MTTLWEIGAVRSDGMQCGGTVDAPTEQAAMYECHYIFRPFVAQAGIYCAKHPGDRRGICLLHRGERFTFSQHSVTRLPEFAKTGGAR